MRKVKHWLHILLTILTSGLWLPVYVILLATTEMFNRGYREGKAAGRVQRQNEIDEERAHEKVRAKQAAWNELQDRINSNPTTTIVGFDGGYAGTACKRTKAVRHAELHERVRTVGLDNEERAEYAQLRQELGQ